MCCDFFVSHLQHSINCHQVSGWLTRGNDGQHVLGLLLPVQGRPQRDDAGICVNPEEVFLSFGLEDVGHLSVRVVVEVTGAEGDDGSPDGQRLSDGGVVDRLLEDGSVVVEVLHGDLETVKRRKVS